MKNNKALDFPWGILCGVCAIIVFFGTIAFVIVYVISNGIAQQTSETVSAFSSWYQVVIFIVDILSAVTSIVSLVMYIVRERVYKSMIGRPTKAKEEIPATEDTSA